MSREDHPNMQGHPNLQRGRSNIDKANEYHEAEQETYAEASVIAAEDLLEGTKRVYGKLLALTETLLDRSIRQRGAPQRVLIDAAKELRQTADRLHEYILANRGAAEAERFFADLASVVEPVAARLEAAARTAPIASARPA